MSTFSTIPTLADAPADISMTSLSLVEPCCDPVEGSTEDVASSSEFDSTGTVIATPNAASALVDMLIGASNTPIARFDHPPKGDWLFVHPVLDPHAKPCLESTPQESLKKDSPKKDSPKKSAKKNSAKRRFPSYMQPTASSSKRVFARRGGHQSKPNFK